MVFIDEQTNVPLINEEALKMIVNTSTGKYRSAVWSLYCNSVLFSVKINIHVILICIVKSPCQDHQSIDFNCRVSLNWFDKLMFKLIWTCPGDWRLKRLPFHTRLKHSKIRPITNSKCITQPCKFIQESRVFEMPKKYVIKIWPNMTKLFGNNLFSYTNTKAPLSLSYHKISRSWRRWPNTLNVNVVNMDHSSTETVV